MEDNLEIIYLKGIHESNYFGARLDLHTYFVEKGFKVCPICNEWLVQRIKPKMEV